MVTEQDIYELCDSLRVEKHDSLWCFSDAQLVRFASYLIHHDYDEWVGTMQSMARNELTAIERSLRCVEPINDEPS